MALKAKSPEAVDKRFKVFMFGGAGVGKTRAALQFGRNYHIDCERGADNYVDLYKASNSVRLQTTDYEEVIDQVRSLATEKHDYQTVTIDPVTTIESDLIMRSEDHIVAAIMAKGKSTQAEAAMEAKGDMRVWRDRDRILKRLGLLLLNLDMNVIVISHGKVEYGDNMKKIGTTFDAWKRWEFMFDLSLEIARHGNRTVATVKKTRLAKFPHGDVFDFSYNAVRDRIGSAIERPVETTVLASAEQVAELKRLVDIVKLPEGQTDKWLVAAQCDCFEDMPADKVAKCIEHVKKLLGSNGESK